MDENSKKEEFSYGYVHTLVSAYGYIVSRSERALDNKGIDLQIIKSKKIEDGQAPVIVVQLKCTTSKYFVEDGDAFKYDLEVKNYNQLRSKSIDPQILIVVLVPEESDKWINIHDIKQETLVNKCGYWVSLQGQAETKNDQRIRIKIPKQNILNEKALEMIMNRSIEERERYFRIKEKEDLTEEGNQGNDTT